MKGSSELPSQQSEKIRCFWNMIGDVRFASYIQLIGLSPASVTRLERISR